MNLLDYDPITFRKSADMTDFIHMYLQDLIGEKVTNFQLDCEIEKMKVYYYGKSQPAHDHDPKQIIVKQAMVVYNGTVERINFTAVNLASVLKEGKSLYTQFWNRRGKELDVMNVIAQSFVALGNINSEKAAELAEVFVATLTDDAIERMETPYNMTIGIAVKWFFKEGHDAK